MDFTTLHFVSAKKIRVPYTWAKDIQSLGKLQFTYVTESQTIVTSFVTVFGVEQETTNTANPNDIVLSGHKKEQYVVANKKLCKNYILEDGSTIPATPTHEDVCGKTIVPEQTERSVAQYLDTKEASFVASWGESMIVEHGDYIVREAAYDGNGYGYYRIKKTEFEASYEIIKK